MADQADNGKENQKNGHEQEPAKTDWEAKYKDAIAHSREWEKKAKANQSAAEELEKIKAEGRSELENAQDRAQKAEAEVASLKAEKERSEWIAAASKETGVPAAALHGNTKEEIDECAEALKEYFKKDPAPVVDSGKPSEDNGGGSGDPLRDLFNSI